MLQGTAVSASARRDGSDEGMFCGSSVHDVMVFANTESVSKYSESAGNVAWQFGFACVTVLVDHSRSCLLVVHAWD